MFIGVKIAQSSLTRVCSHSAFRRTTTANPKINLYIKDYVLYKHYLYSLRMFSGDDTQQRYLLRQRAIEGEVHCSRFLDLYFLGG